MDRYFECLSEDDERVILNDSFQNLELIEIVPMSRCEKRSINGSVDYVVPQTSNAAKDDCYLFGVSLAELQGKSFCVDITRQYDSPNTWALMQFYDPPTLFTTVARDDIVKVGNLYIFGTKKRSPSEHLTGLEVFDANGRVVYSSNARYLDVSYCGGDDPASYAYDADTLLFLLSEDIIVDQVIYLEAGTVGSNRAWKPLISVSNNTVSINKVLLEHKYEGVPPRYDPIVDWYSEVHAYAYMIAKAV